MKLDTLAWGRAQNIGKKASIHGWSVQINYLTLNRQFSKKDVSNAANAIYQSFHANNLGLIAAEINAPWIWPISKLLPVMPSLFLQLRLLYINGGCKMGPLVENMFMGTRHRFQMDSSPNFELCFHPFILTILHGGLIHWWLAELSLVPLLSCCQ